ncbi:MAG: LPS export ABC transporter periplasmic protein LptC [Deltaproteobacteria bacterium]|jgi:hypothetical protein|nr:LPS export ABC transporter periplasmic protein LptC [Deltaproteobacteria bacterium]
MIRMQRHASRVTRGRIRSARDARWVSRAILLVLIALGGPAGAGPPDLGWLDGDRGQALDLHGMTFVASEATANEILLRAEKARFYPELEVAELEAVHVEVAPGEGRVGFSMECEGGRLNLASQSFVAEGNVVGTIEGGRHFEAAWVAYDEAEGLLYTDEPVLIEEDEGRYRGGGFRYLVEERRFRLLGGASIVQE